MSARAAKPASDAASDPAEALAFLRARFTADLMVDEERVGVRFVLDNETGAPVANVGQGVFDAEALVLHVPEDADGAMQLLVSATEIDGANHAAADRWRIHHGDAKEARWAAFTVEGGRFGGRVVEGEDLMKPNALAAAEPALCRRCNADKEVLRRALAAAGHEIEGPVCVGVDPWGISVRARFAIVRVAFAGAPVEAGAAEGLVEEFLAGGSAAP